MGPREPERCERVSLTTATKQILWSSSGGYCQNPACQTKRLFLKGQDVHFGELAHIIPAARKGPRASTEKAMSADGRSHHSNIIVLCANCHTVVDKDPRRFPAELLRDWKARHAQRLEVAVGSPEFTNRSEAFAYVSERFDENSAIFQRYGPLGAEISDASAGQWRRHIISTMIPNNTELAAAFRRNRNLLLLEERAVVDQFLIHVKEFEERHLLDDFSSGTTRFPSQVVRVFGEHSEHS